MLQSAGLHMLFAATFYTIFIYLSTWLVDEVHERRADSLYINTISMAAFIVSILSFSA
jgi:hypothetical protein